MMSSASSSKIPKFRGIVTDLRWIADEIETGGSSKPIRSTINHIIHPWNDRRLGALHRLLMLWTRHKPDGHKPTELAGLLGLLGKLFKEPSPGKPEQVVKRLRRYADYLEQCVGPARIKKGRLTSSTMAISEANTARGTPVDMRWAAPATYKAIDPWGERTLVVPPKTGLPYVDGYPGAIVDIVLDVEARTGTRLREGGNPQRFLRIWHNFQDRKDPEAGISFAEYCARRHADTIDIARKKLGGNDSAEGPAAARAMPAVEPAAAPIQQQSNPRKGKGGRPRLSRPEEMKRGKLLKQWKRAQEAGTQLKDFCRDNGLELSYMEGVNNWAAQRRRRSESAS